MTDGDITHEVDAPPPWPEIPLATVLQHDPFRPLRSAARSPQTADRDVVASDTLARHAAREQMVDDLRVELIVAGNRSKMAKINSRLVRVGDAIEGFVVKDIRADGVILVEQDAR